MNKLLKAFGLKYEYIQIIRSLNPSQVKRIGKDVDYVEEILIRIYVPGPRDIIQYTPKYGYNRMESDLYRYQVVIYV